MGKYITQELYSKFEKVVPELPRKSTLEELWNAVHDKFELDAELVVDKVKTKKATLSFTVKGKEYKVERHAGEIYVTNENGDVRAERYELLIMDALKVLAGLKLWKKSDRTRNKKEKV